MFGIEVGGGVMAALAAFLMVVAVLALFVPFFILRIRNEMIAMNKTLKEILILLEQDRAKDAIPMRPSTEPLAWAKKKPEE